MAQSEFDMFKIQDQVSSDDRNQLFKQNEGKNLQNNEQNGPLPQLQSFM